MILEMLADKTDVSLKGTSIVVAASDADDVVHWTTGLSC